MNAEESRKIMNDFNFKGLYECYDEEKKRYHKFEEYQNDKVYAKLTRADNISDPHNILAKKKDLDEKLENTKFRCGIISNGNHGLDLLEIYNENHKNDPIDFKKFEKVDEETKVMFVFDSPANNLKDCFGYDENLEDLFKKEPKEFLCKHLWRSKDLDIDNCKNKEVLTGSKSYGQMIVSFMYNYKMKNVYTTNLFRYEITARNKEAFVSLGSMKKKDLVDPVFENIFLKEAEAFKPDIIVAVGKTVYNYLNTKTRLGQLVGRKLVPVYHPKARVTREDKKKCFDHLKEEINHVRDSK